MRSAPLRSPAAVAVAGVLILGLAGCGGDTTTTPAPSSTPTPSASTSTSPSADPSESIGETAGPTPSTGGAQGSAEAPVAVTASDALLDWTPLPGRVIDTVTADGKRVLTLDQSGGFATLVGAGPKGARMRISAGAGRTVSDALLDDDWAVVVAQDRSESRPAVATVVDLATGKQTRIDGSSSVPTTTGGSFTLAGDTLLHPTVRDGAYCLASVDLATGDSQVGYCAPARNGFNSALLTDAGLGILTFDDSRPSCRTAVTLDGSQATPLPGVADCAAWQGMPTPDGAVWSTIPKPRRIEHAEYFARSGYSWFDLEIGRAHV